ncbi:MAG: BBP7 family outer membrane beta-barrel protein [Lacipirellulaceae bacterium]
MTKFTVACLLLLCGSVAQAQVEDPFCNICCNDFDSQYFAPVDFDFDCRPIRKDCGFFFNYDRIAWVTTGERHPLGLQGGTAAGSLNAFRVFDSGGIIVLSDPTDPDSDEIFVPGDEFIIPAPLRPNGIMNAAPRASVGYGHRYEGGYFHGNAGWLVGVLDGFDSISAQNFGFGFTPQDNTNGGALGLPSGIPNNPNNQLLSPLGSVPIAFEDPGLTVVLPGAAPGGGPLTTTIPFMSGFIDVRTGATGGVPGGSLEADSNGDGVLDGDGLADDIDRDGQFGPDGLEGGDPGEVPNVIGGGLPHDFGDLVELPTSWQSIQIRNRTRIDGVELMRTHVLDNRHKMATKQNSFLQMGYGVRFFQLDDNFRVDGQGGVLGDSFWDTSIVNNIVGPQIALAYKSQRGRFLFDFNGRFMFGYNIQNMDQTAALGEDLIPGQHNHPLYFPPTVSNHGRQEEDFAPLVEIRANASYQVTKALALKLGYTGTFVDNIRRASQHVRYRLPDMGFRDDAGTQNIFVNGVNGGFEVVY